MEDEREPFGGRQRFEHDVVAAARRDRVAAALLVPYLGWTAFATALNAAVRLP